MLEESELFQLWLESLKEVQITWTEGREREEGRRVASVGGGGGKDELTGKKEEQSRDKLQITILALYLLTSRQKLRACSCNTYHSAAAQQFISSTP